jgi:hypothetical protein
MGYLSHNIKESMYSTLVILSSSWGFTDVLTAALADTLTEQPHLLNVAREGLLEGSPGSQLLHQLLMLNPATASGDHVSNSVIDNTFQFQMIMSRLIHRLVKIPDHKMPYSDIFSHSNILQSSS